MASQAKQKQKLLFMKNLFEQKSDENHPITGIQLIDILAEKNIKCERKTVYDDIDTLKESGMDIITTKVGHSNAYFLGQRLFQEEELSVLAACVASSRFLTKRKSGELIDKLMTLTSEFKAPMLSRTFFIRNRAKGKSGNEQIYYNINAINDGVNNDKDITFKYFDYTPDKKKVARHGGELYTVSPYNLVYNDDNYYLICSHYKREQISFFRVDRMVDVKVTENKRHPLTDDENSFVKEQQAAIFEMYPGNQVEAEIKFDNSLMNPVVDRFTDRVNIERVDENSFKIRVNVQLSPTFYGWLFKFGDKAELLSPQEAVEEAKGILDNIRRLYDK